MDEIRILIVEDEPIIAENIAMYLNNADFAVSGIAYDSEEALSQLKNNTPDAALLDINLDGGKDGIELAGVINNSYHIPFLFLTSYSDRQTLERAKTMQPSGYIVKPFHEKTLISSVEIAVSNYALKSNQHLPQLRLEKINKRLLSPLREREFEVLKLIYEGKTNNQIAAELYVSINTIKVHIKNAYLKLDAETRTSAIVCLRNLMLK